MGMVFRLGFLLAVPVAAAAAPGPVADPAVLPVTVSVDAAQPIRTWDRRRLLGTNLALWNDPPQFANPEIKRWFRDVAPALIRIPGGSWGDITFWNGNGMHRKDGSVDLSRVDAAGYPLIDYARYEPQVTTENDGTIRTGGWHGHVDVRLLHEWVRAVGAKAVVIVNGGTGRPRDAAEWVRWARARRYPVEYWEVGNELDGSWEAGHVQRDGKELTAAGYSARYAEFVAAMKAVDRTIKVGPAAVNFGPGSFGEAVLRDHADLVDFFPVHTYPVLGSDPVEAAFDKLATLGAQVAEVRATMRRVAPERAASIPITYTEWNGATHRGAGDLTGALWSCLWIGELFRHGVESANEWDALSDGDGGYGWVAGSRPAWRKAQYWAFWLWSRRMGDTLLPATVAGGPKVSAVATRGPDEVQVMLVNRDPDQPTTTRIALTGFIAAERGSLTTLSPREYLWDDAAGHPRWSREPSRRDLPTGQAFEVTVPPYSVVVATVPARGAHARPRSVPPAVVGRPRLAISLPAEAWAEGVIHGWVYAITADGTPWPEPLPDAALSVEGPASLVRPAVRLAEAAGRIAFTASATGVVAIHATLGDVSASATLYLKPAVPRPVVLWEFEAPALDPAKYHSDWKLSTDLTVRPNQAVARVDFSGVPLAADQRGVVLRIEDFPPRDRLDRAGIRGVFMDAALGPSFACADPAATLDIVMQSTDNWWMSLGFFPVANLSRAWSTWTFPVHDERHLAAVGNAMNVWVILRSASPPSGALYLDRAGLLVR